MASGIEAVCVISREVSLKGRGQALLHSFLPLLPSGWSSSDWSDLGKNDTQQINKNEAAWTMTAHSWQDHLQVQERKKKKMHISLLKLNFDRPLHGGITLDSCVPEEGDRWGA